MSLQPRILFLDAYDSFSHNIIALLEAQCNVHVTSIYIDASIPDFENYSSQFSAIVCGPGPGHPACSRDIGLFKKVWALSEDKLLPVLGICLGFQSLAFEFGASVERLPQPRHGISTRVTSRPTSIFAGLESINTVQYHSLHACLKRDMSETVHDRDLWVPSQECPELQPLAWDRSSPQGMIPRFSKNPASILMAVKHTSKPFHGIQFHPESICSGPQARQIISNWWQIAKVWSLEQKLKCAKVLYSPDTFDIETGYESTTPSPRRSLDKSPENSSAATSIAPPEKAHPKVSSVTLPLGHLTIPAICEALDLLGDDLVVLDSEMRQLPDLGESSIIGIVTPETQKILYSVGGKEIILQTGEKSEHVNLARSGDNVFSYLKEFMSMRTIERSDDRAFYGGLMGYISYEACSETLNIDAQAQTNRPDICFAFVERSILIDHKHHLLHVQELMYDDPDCETSQWVSQASATLVLLSSKTTSSVEPQALSILGTVLHSQRPEGSEYMAKICECKKLISAGESYELCLTDQTTIDLKDNLSEWDMYKRLRSLNPANFGAFVRLGPLTLLSTSPERFMKWSRFHSSSTPNSTGADSNDQTAICQFRPMKGTVRKRQQRPDGSVHHLTREEATAILAAPKDQAENLMIVDLIRHDLHTVCRDVSVPGLMVIEEYESVYQMSSVIEGEIKKPSYFGPAEGKCGIDCLAASLPPGSMTGAPKKRSCELLQGIEKKPRSIYSGVLGYIDVSGKGDFSVIIRSMYKWDDNSKSEGARWNIGAGGAVTTLSTEQGEWEEMLTKLQSTYRVFES
ncbi:hypothetical protein ACLMJK_001425 [Lecanora helva]